MEFYNGIKMTGRYDLVGLPAEANWFFEINFVSILPINCPDSN